MYHLSTIYQSLSIPFSHIYLSTVYLSYLSILLFHSVSYLSLSITLSYLSICLSNLPLLSIFTCLSLYLSYLSIDRSHYLSTLPCLSISFPLFWTLQCLPPYLYLHLPILFTFYLYLYLSSIHLSFAFLSYSPLPCIFIYTLSTCLLPSYFIYLYLPPTFPSYLPFLYHLASPYHILTSCLRRSAASFLARLNTR